MKIPVLIYAGYFDVWINVDEDLYVNWCFDHRPGKK